MGGGGGIYPTSPDQNRRGAGSPAQNPTSGHQNDQQNAGLFGLNTNGAKGVCPVSLCQSGAHAPSPPTPANAPSPAPNPSPYVCPEFAFLSIPLSPPLKPTTKLLFGRGGGRGGGLCVAGAAPMSMSQCCVFV